MGLGKRTSIVLLLASVGVATLATAEPINSEQPVSANYLPEEFTAFLSSLGNVGDVVVENVDAVPLDRFEAAAQSGSISDVTSVTEVAGSVGELATSFIDDLPVNQGVVVEPGGLTQVVAGNTITSSVSGNRVDVSGAVENENRIVDSFNNLEVPIAYSQNSGIASSVTQQITVQVGIALPDPVAVTQ